MDRYQTAYPVAAGPIIVRGNGAVCRLPQRMVEFRAPSRLLQSIVALCQGDHSRVAIIDQLSGGWDAEQVAQLLARLEEEGVLVDKSDIAATIWSPVKHPQAAVVSPTLEELSAAVEQAVRETEEVSADARYFAVPSSPLHRLLEKRCSTRRFSRRSVPIARVVTALWAAYGVPHRRSVPSAGGLYPLQVHLIQLRPEEDLPEGVYRVWYHWQEGVGLQCISEQAGESYAAWMDPGILMDAQGVFVLSGDFARTAAKYGNRAALFVPIEAGHAAQNILLSAAETGIGVVELGGFVEDRLSALLRLRKDVTPLITIAYGWPLEETGNATESHTSCEFRWVDAAAAYRPPFFLGTAIAQPDAADWCWGASADPKTAYIKAVSEAVERSACAAPRNLVRASMGDMKNAVIPWRIVAYTPEQYKRIGFPFAPFELTREYSWVEGEDYFSGRRASVLADFVYYRSDGSIESGEIKPYTFANSSGVAAFPAAEGALERAVLELVERHAFMAAWLSNAKTPAISLSSIPQEVQRRVRALNDAGFDVVLKDITFGVVPVVLVFAQSVARHVAKVSTCAAYDPSAALDHALAEVEASIAVRLSMNTERRASLTASAVRSPSDHGDLYAHQRYFRKADRLAASDTTRRLVELEQGAPTNWQMLSAWLNRQQLPILVFSLRAGDAQADMTGRLSVVRAIMPGLIPMSFGYGTEPLGTPCIGELRMPAARRRMLATQPLFPHPFS